MAQQQPRSRAERLQHQWLDLRNAGSILYDVLLWQDMTWPVLSLAWLPQSWAQPPGVAAAEAAARQRRQQDFDQHQQQQQQQHNSSDAMQVDAPSTEQPAAAAPGDASQPQQQQLPQNLVPMPVECHYLLTGSQTSGNGASHVDLYRVEVPGQLAAAPPPGQQVLMQKGDMQQVMRVSHGLLDVNRLAVMPQQPNIIATCCDEPEVYLFDLRQHTVQEWAAEDAAQEQDGSSSSGSGSGDDAGSVSGNADDSDDDAAGGDSDTNSNTPSEPPHPQAVLTGRPAGGFGLAFNPLKPGLLLGADAQGGVQLWDVEGCCSGSSGGGDSSSSVVPRISPMQAAEHFAPCAINDVTWHRQGTAFALATEQGEVWVQDLRAPTTTQPSSSTANGAGGGSSSRSHLGLTQFAGPGVTQPSTVRSHVKRHRKPQCQQQQQEQQQQQAASIPSDCFCVAFDPSNEHRLASGGADGYVSILDMRRLSQPVDQLGLHAGSVTSVAWSHSFPGLLASAGEDGAVMLWQADKLQHAAVFGCGVGPHQQQQQDGRGLQLPAPRPVREYERSLRHYSSPGLLFMHAGHFGAVGGLALNPDRPWLVASSTACVVDAPDSSGSQVVIQRQPVMVWEPNASHGLLC